MSERKPILIVDDSDDSQTAIKLFDKKSIEYVQYHIDKLASGCCGGTSNDTSTLGTLTAPEVIAPEGVFRGLDRIKNYFDSERRYYESESAYW
jgi:hypothetical protein